MIPYALYNSKINFEPFQYKPFFEFVENVDKHLFIADEVGVGKTIETGIIISELLYGDKDSDWVKGSLDNPRKPKVVILAPTSLCAQWKEELEDKFMIHSCNCYADSKGFDANNDVRIYGQSFKQLEMIDGLNEHYDVLIVDEAHNFRNKHRKDIFSGEERDSKQYKYLSNIAKRSKRIILLSATPIFNSEEDFDNELNLLDNNYCITQTTKTISKCLDFQPIIKSQLVKLNPVEEKLYWTIENTGINNLTKSAVFLHEACSSMSCLAETLVSGVEKYVKTLFQDSEIPSEVLQKIVRHLQSGDENPLSYKFKEYGVRTIETTYNYKKLLEAYGKEYLSNKDKYPDSKLEVLKTIIDEKLTKEKGYAMKKKHIVIFAHFIATCNYLYSFFKQDTSWNVFLATGENTKDEIDQSIECFNKTCKDDVKNSIIICSDVCKEGKNMQNCQVLINFDLPFSPSIMQQRIGRIDRNGQKNVPIIYNLICDIPNDIHTYFDIIFSKVQLINGVEEICSVDVLKETNQEVRRRILEEWKKEEYKKSHDKLRDDYSVTQSAFVNYLKNNMKDINDYFLSQEIDDVSSLSDEEILEKMNRILFLTPNAELKKIREREHVKGKTEISKKIYGYPCDSNMSLREMMRLDILSKLKRYLDCGMISYDADSDSYTLSIEEKKIQFFKNIVSNQFFMFFKNLEDDEIIVNGFNENMYYDEADIAFISSIYKEVSDNSNNQVKHFDEQISEEFNEMFVPLYPLIHIMNAIID